MKQVKYESTTRLDECDRMALAEAHAALAGPQAAVNALHALIGARYSLRPGLDIINVQTGAILRKSE